MSNLSRFLQGLKLTAVFVAALSLAACANKSALEDSNALANAGAATPGSQQDFVVNVGDRVFFETDSTELTQQAVGVLNKQVQWLQTYNRYSFTIEGHADERGTREYNLGLGARRATSVKNMLVSLGIEAGRVRTISYGKERPAEAGSTEEAWGKNRRGVAVPAGSGA